VPGSRKTTKAEGFVFPAFFSFGRGAQLYTGITTDLDHRMKQLKAALLYSEPHPDPHAAAVREKLIRSD
jgi:predicted GIY-YIG superfamily endonuclease